jgi:hypothetical protein
MVSLEPLQLTRVASQLPRDFKWHSPCASIGRVYLCTTFYRSVVTVTEPTTTVDSEAEACTVKDLIKLQHHQALENEILRSDLDHLC